MTLLKLKVAMCTSKSGINDGFSGFQPQVKHAHEGETQT
ncbi:hypothetical protein PT7_1181 [Pusillimonas sp. T7-7]|nr:hypothetical protein PT7_1181 [Pusillimonas sp. T7-7]